MLLAVDAVAAVARDGDKVGEEKDNRYKAIKKSSLRAQNINRTVYDFALLVL